MQRGTGERVPVDSTPVHTRKQYVVCDVYTYLSSIAQCVALGSVRVLVQLNLRIIRAPTLVAELESHIIRTIAVIIAPL